MTNEELDNSLINRINEVFTDMEHTGADEGWLLLREKYPPANKKPVAWFWWGMAAALILVGLGTGIWMTGTKHQPKNTNVVKTNNAKSKRDLMQQSAPKTIIDSHILPIPHKVQDAANNQSTINNKPIIKQNNAISAPQNNNQTTATNVITQPNTASTKVIENTDKQSAAVHSPKENNTLTDNSAQQSADTTKMPDKLVTKTATPVKPKPGESKKETSAKAAKKLVFGVYASGYYNYASGSVSQFNWGAGTNLDIKLVGNFRLSTGIGVAQNTLNYDAKPPVQTPVNQPLTSSSSTVYTGGAIFKNYQASLLALNVPISLKYQFLKPYSYISAGFVSGTYINEKYNETFTNGLLQISSPDVHNIIQKHFNSFDLFKTMNISAGIGYPVSKKNVLVVEPFLNAPLGGLGYNNIKFGSAGLNLKLNFETAKK